MALWPFGRKRRKIAAEKAVQKDEQAPPSQPDPEVPTLARPKRSSADAPIPRPTSVHNSTNNRTLDRDPDARNTSSSPSASAASKSIRRPHSYTSGILARDTRKVPGGLNRNLERPTSEISLPPAESIRSSLSAISEWQQSYFFIAGALDSLAPRPTISYSESPRRSGIRNGRMTRNSMRKDKEKEKEPQRYIGADTPIPEEEGDNGKTRVDDLADGLDTHAIRELMDRDRRRRERKRMADHEKLQKKLQQHEPGHASSSGQKRSKGAARKGKGKSKAQRTEDYDDEPTIATAPPTSAAAMEEAARKAAAAASASGQTPGDGETDRGGDEADDEDEDIGGLGIIQSPDSPHAEHHEEHRHSPMGIPAREYAQSPSSWLQDPSRRNSRENVRTSPSEEVNPMSESRLDLGTPSDRMSMRDEPVIETAQYIRLSSASMSPPIVASEQQQQQQQQGRHRHVREPSGLSNVTNLEPDEQPDQNVLLESDDDHDDGAVIVDEKEHVPPEVPPKDELRLVNQQRLELEQSPEVPPKDYPEAMMPFSSPQHHRLPIQGEIPPTPPPKEPDPEPEPEPARAQGSSWISFFRRGTRGRKKKEKQKQRSATFPNELEDTAGLQQKRSSSLRNIEGGEGTSIRDGEESPSDSPQRQRTQSRFREDLPELPADAEVPTPPATATAEEGGAEEAASPSSQVQSPEHLSRGSSPYIDDASKLSNMNIEGHAITPIANVHPAFRDEVTTTAENGKNQAPTSDPTSAHQSTTGGGAALLSRSLASVDSEGSWLSGRPPKRSSNPISVGGGGGTLRESQSSLSQRIPEDGSISASSPDQPTASSPSPSAGFSRREVTLSPSHRGPGGLTTQLRSIDTTGPAIEKHRGAMTTKERDTNVQSMVVSPLDELPARFDSVRGRRPRIIERSREGSVSAEMMGLDEESRQGSGSAAPEEELVSPISPASESSPDLPNLGEAEVRRATSVEYKGGRRVGGGEGAAEGGGHVRHVSAGSARLLDIPARASGEQLRRQHQSPSGGSGRGKEGPSNQAAAGPENATDEDATIAALQAEGDVPPALPPKSPSRKLSRS